MKKIKHLMNIEYCLEKQKCRTIKTIMIDKKGKLLIKNLYIDDICDNIEKIRKHKLVVFNVEENQKEEILNFFCAQNKKGLLAEVDEKEIYYFPDLNYQDAYLIKHLLENKCSINSSLKIISGNNVV